MGATHREIAAIQAAKRLGWTVRVEKVPLAKRIRLPHLRLWHCWEVCIYSAAGYPVAWIHHSITKNSAVYLERTAYDNHG